MRLVQIFFFLISSWWVIRHRPTKIQTLCHRFPKKKRTKTKLKKTTMFVVCRQSSLDCVKRRRKPLPYFREKKNNNKKNKKTKRNNGERGRQQQLTTPTRCGWSSLWGKMSPLGLLETLIAQASSQSPTYVDIRYPRLLPDPLLFLLILFKFPLFFLIYYYFFRNVIDMQFPPFPYGYVNGSTTQISNRVSALLKKKKKKRLSGKVLESQFEC